MTSASSAPAPGAPRSARPTSLVLGAAGFLGLNLVDHLLASGDSPRCGHRHRTNTIPLKRRGVERVIADCGDRAPLNIAMRDVDVVYHLAGHYPRDARTPAITVARALHELDNVLDAAAASGVRRLVYVSSTATVARRPDGAPSSEADVFPVLPNIGAYHDVKWHMERRVLAEDRFEVSVACPSACLGPWDLRVGTSALIVATARGLAPQHPDGLVNLVDARDVARVLNLLGTHPTPPRRLLISAHSVGLHDFLTDLSHRLGVPAPPRPLTPEAAMAFADDEERRVADTPERARLAREIVDLILHAVPLDTSLVTSLLTSLTTLSVGPTTPFTPLWTTVFELLAFASRMRMVPSNLPPLHG